MMTKAATLLVLLALVSCGPKDDVNPPRPIQRAFTQDFYNTNIQELEATAKRTPIIAVGRITAIADSPGIWSGEFVTTQAVTYSSLRSLRGTISSPTATVHHVLVRNSPTADPSTPRLNPAIFAVGKSVIVLVEENNRRLESLNEAFGAIPYDAKNEAALMGLL